MKQRMLREKVSYWASIISIGVLLGFSLQFAKAWVGPTGTPSVDNVGAPINTSSVGQYKDGGLLINRLGGSSNGLIVANGKVGIGLLYPKSPLEINSGDEAIGNVGFGTPGMDMWFDGGTDGYFPIANTSPLDSGATDFVRNLDGGWSNLQSLLHIGNDGRIGIGTKYPSNELGFMKAALEVAGQVKAVKYYDDDPNYYADLNVGGHLGGDWQFDGNIHAGGVVSWSDYRLKDNISEIDGALDKISKINGVTFNWKDPKMGSDKSVGVIAQEIEKVYPYVVVTDQNGYKSVDYSKITPLLIESVKELKKNNDTQKEQINDQQEQIKELRMEIEKINERINDK